MANATQSGSDSLSQSQSDQLNHAILNTNFNAYVTGGGNPNNYVLGPGGIFQQGPAGAGTNPYAGLLGGYGGGGGGNAFDVGGGHTRWDEFVQQMQLEQDKLKQAQALQAEQIAAQRAMEEQRLAQEKALADQNTVESFNKDLMGMKGPADPYGYLFSSRGLAAPQGYAPTAMPLAPAVEQAYKDQGVDLSQAQKQLSGSSGPSFIQGYLGGMSPALQQGPMGFQNSPEFKDVAPGSQPTTPPAPQGMASGGVVPGFAPGQDTVPAMLSPGEGILKPQVVRELGGPSVINAMNSSPQHFAGGGVAQPISGQPITELGNGLYQRGSETGTARAANPQDLQPNPGWWPLPGGGQGVPVWSGVGNAAAPVASTGFGESGIQITGPEGPSGVPVIVNGQAGFMNPVDLASYQMPYTGTKASLNPDLPAGYALQSPGVATRSAGAMPARPVAPNGVPEPAAMDPGWVRGIEDYFAGTGHLPQGGAWHHTSPLGTESSPPAAPMPPVGATGGGGSPLLTGGQLSPLAPPGGPPMNLNMLDPYTRSLVDQYGRPQIPSAQALASMPQSGVDAYKDYTEKVAGGNFQDLLDQSKMMNPSGANPADFKFS